MAVFFVFLRNIPLPIEILKIKILEYSYPPSQYFFVNKAFIRFSSCRRKVALCHLAEWHIARKIFLTFSLILRILALRRLDPRSFSYFSQPPLQNALGICSCTLELELIPLKNHHLHRRWIKPFPQLLASHDLKTNLVLFKFNSRHSGKLKICIKQFKFESRDPSEFWNPEK